MAILERVLIQMGFHLIFVNWVMQCISTVTYSFLINEEATGNVVPSRGIRQGDPMSPYVFILCGEVLSGLCREAQRDGSMTGIIIATKCPRINHLLFADDTMFFVRSSPQSCTALKDILAKYERASGQMINTSKSSISFSALTTQEDRNRVKQTLGIDQEGGVGKYLGLPELFGRKKRDLFASIIDRIKQRAVSWSSRQLSPAGKLTMLKSVLTAIPTFSMTCFLLPVSLCKRIQSVLTRFWWDDSDSTRKISWVSWETLTKPKSMGGLGLRDIQHFNKALLGKLAWKILTKPNCLLSRMLIGKYCQSDSFLRVTCSSSASHGWRGIIEGRNVIIQLLGKIIGNGNSTKLWHEPWLSVSTPTSMMGPITMDEKDLMVSDIMTRETGMWNREALMKHVPHLIDEILLIHPSSTGAEDAYAWLLNPTGDYSSKSGYLALHLNDSTTTRNSNIPDDFNWFKSVWGSAMMPKIQLFLWKVLQGAIPTGENLQKRGVLTNTNYIRCGAQETTNHLFFHCDFAKQVWELAPWTSPLQSETTISFGTELQTSSLRINLPPVGVSINIFPWIIWALWISRNLLLFEHRTLTPTTTMTRARVSAREWTLAQTTLPAPTGSIITPIATEPTTPDSMISCFTDASWIARTKHAGLAWIFTDRDKKELNRGSASTNHISSPLMAESLAIRAAMLHASTLGYTNIWIHSDSQELVRAINGKRGAMEIYGVLSDIVSLSLSFSLCRFTFISRSENGPADSLAKSALSFGHIGPSVV